MTITFGTWGHSLKHWANTNFDYIIGFGGGSTTGLLTIANFYSALYAIVMAFLTGAAGATAAHLIRLLFDKLKKPKNGR